MSVMSRILPFILVCVLLFCPTDSTPATKSAQHTEGDQSPIVNVASGGQSTINYYNYNVYVFTGKLPFSDTELNSIKPEDMQKKIAENRIADFNSSPEEANKWAENFIETLSIRKERSKTEKLADLRHVEKTKLRLLTTIGYILYSFDQKILALKDKMANIGYVRQIQDFEIFVNGKLTKLDIDSMREVSFPNRNSLFVLLKNNRISMQKRQFEGIPELRFIKHGHHESESLLVIRFPLTGFMTNDSTPSLIYYPAQEQDTILTEAFMKNVSEALDNVISELI